MIFSEWLLFSIFMTAVWINIIYIPLYVIFSIYLFIRYRKKKSTIKDSIKKSLPYFLGGFLITIIIGIIEPKCYDPGCGLYTHFTAFAFMVIIPSIVFILYYRKNK